MPVNKFGSSKIDKPATNIIHTGGVSLAYLDRNFERKGANESLSTQGGNIHGNLNMFGMIGMNGNPVRGLPNSISHDDEAVSKKYVGEQILPVLEVVEDQKITRVSEILILNSEMIFYKLVCIIKRIHFFWCMLHHLTVQK